MVRFLVWEDPTCRRAAEPMHLNYWACALELGSHNYRAHVLQLLKPACPRTHALQKGRPPKWEAYALQVERSPQSPQLQKSPRSHEDPVQPKINKTSKQTENTCLLSHGFCGSSPVMAYLGLLSRASSGSNPGVSQCCHLIRDSTEKEMCFHLFEAVGMPSSFSSWLSAGMALHSQRPLWSLTMRSSPSTLSQCGDFFLSEPAMDSPSVHGDSLT